MKASRCNRLVTQSNHIQPFTINYSSLSLCPCQFEQKSCQLLSLYWRPALDRYYWAAPDQALGPELLSERKKKKKETQSIDFWIFGILFIYLFPSVFPGLCSAACSALYNAPFAPQRAKKKKSRSLNLQECVFHLFNGNAPGREIVCPNHGHGVGCKSSGQWYRLLGLCLRGLEQRQKLAFSQEIKTVNYESNNVDPNNSCSRDWTNAEFA